MQHFIRNLNRRYSYYIKTGQVFKADRLAKELRAMSLPVPNVPYTG